jgi:hypothetical protein
MAALAAPLLGTKRQSASAGFVPQIGDEFVAFVHRRGRTFDRGIIGQNCPKVKSKTKYAPRVRGRIDKAQTNRLVYDRFLLETRDLVFDVQLVPLQFRDSEPIRRWVGKCFADLLLQRLVSSLEFRKMRFDRHVAFLLASDCCLTPTPE